MVIIAGYENELKECFFSYNPGLESRFIWRYKTDKYTDGELKDILIKKIREIEWNIDIDETTLINWFKKQSKYFKYYGRSIEILLTKSKIAHSRRIFSDSCAKKKYLNLSDINNGLEMMDLKNNNSNTEYIYSLYR